MVDVSGYSYAPDGALLSVSVKLDGVHGSPYEVQFSGDDGQWAAAPCGGASPFRGVPPGTHAVSMVYESLDGRAVFRSKQRWWRRRWRPTGGILMARVLPGEQSPAAESRSTV